jgi:hypothetical protein
MSLLVVSKCVRYALAPSEVLVSRYLISRLLACGVLAFFMGLVTHGSYVKWSHAGLQSFLDYQQARFTKYMAPPVSVLHTFFVQLFLALLAAIFYELCVFTFSTIASRLKSRD